MEELIIGMLVLVFGGTLLALVLSIIALKRSRHSQTQRDQIESLERRVRVLWNEIVISRGSHLPTRTAAPAEQTFEEQVAPQTLTTTPDKPANLWKDVITATAVEPTEESTVRQLKQPLEPKCPECHRPWNESYCRFCGYRVAPVHPTPSAHAPSEGREQSGKEHESSQQMIPPERLLLSPALQPHPPETEAWETVIGASWLNKIGVLVLVVGIALFIGYSLTQLGPAGRLAIGFAISACLLGIGVALERQSPFRIFARGLAAGGWAGLYFTTYAMHGLDAARVIDNPTLALLLLIAVATGMIAHSLYFRTEVVTALAYFCGFVAIAINPVSLFSAVACLVLAGTLLVVAYRFSWDLLAVLGIVCTYGTFAIRYFYCPILYKRF